MKERGVIVLGGGKIRGRAVSKTQRRIRRVVIVMLTVFFVAWSLNWSQEQARTKQAQLDVSRISHAVRLFRADFGRCPADVEELVEPPEGLPYLTEYTDPWGQKYEFICPARMDPSDVDVMSWGAKGRLGGEYKISTL